MRQLVRLATALFTTVAVFAMPTAAHAGVTGCSVVAGAASLTLDNTGMSFFNIEMPAAPGLLQVNAVGGGGVSTPCAGITATTLTSLTITGAGANEAVQLYTDNMPATATFAFDGAGAIDNFAVLVHQGTSTDDSVAVGANGIDLDGDGSDIDVAWSNTESYTVSTYGGADTIDLTGPGVLGGGVSNLMVNAGSGNDSVTGSSEGESIQTEAGDDVVRDGAGADQVQLGSGDDSLVIGATVDSGDNYYGEGDDDTIDYSARAAGVTLTPGDVTNNDGAGGAAEGDDLDGTFEVFIGTDDADTMSLADNVSLGANLQGRGGADVLTATSGLDSLTGGAGDDTLNGGAGADSYSADASSDGADTIVELDAGTGDIASYTARSEALSFTVDALANDGAAGEGDLVPSTIERIDAASGDDAITLDADGGTEFRGGTGTDSLTATVTTAATLSDTQLVATGTDTLDSVERASITIGAGGSSLDASSFTGRLTAVGNGDSNTITGGSGWDAIDGGAGTDTLIGGDGTDTITGGTGSDSIDGGSGPDTLVETIDEGATATSTQLTWSGGDVDTISALETLQMTGGASANAWNVSAFPGTVTLDGAAGDDAFTLSAGAAADVVAGGLGTDTVAIAVDASITITDAALTAAGTDAISGIERAQLTGGASDNTIDARSFSGTVVLDGNGGNDTLHGSAGNDTLVGGAGSADQVILAPTGDLTLSDAAIGSDVASGIEVATVTGGDAAQVLDASGFSGTLTLDAGAGADTIRTGTGSSTVTPGAGADTVVGGTGTDLLISAGDGALTLSDAALVAGSETDAISGVDVAQLSGGSGADTIDASGFSGTTTIDAGAGDDAVAGSAGSDTIVAGSGTDRILVTVNAAITLTDTQLTGAGTDVISAFERATLTGGSSANTISASTFTGGAVTVSGGGGADTITGSSAADSLAGGTGSDRITGGAGADTISGGTGSDTLVGGSGSDRMTGGSGNDVLSGGTGNDTLTGSAGKDRYIAGAGTDTINARDRARDGAINCGSGSRDRVTIDRTKDTSVTACERITRR